LDKQHLDTFDKRIPGQLPTYRLDHYTSCGPIPVIVWFSWLHSIVQPDYIYIIFTLII